jgi:fructuronate reductase
MAQPSVHIISLTITEKGYCRDAASNRLDLMHPDVVHDLANPARPRSALGLLCAALEQRRHAGTAAPTLLCCDNLPHNGATLRNVLQDYAMRVEPRLAEWIAVSVACPCTMVDRIVPATTTADLTAAAAALGMRDEALVKTEPFSQWVIEDRFSGPRPALEKVGVQMVADVRPFETAKLRLLNGSHSTLAYVGNLAGYSFVHEAIADPEIRTLIQRLMRDELAPTLQPAPGLDLPDYQRSLVTRFDNSALPYRLRQIAMDGTQKLPQRLLEPLRIRLQRQLPVTAITFALAAWMRYVVGRTEAGEAYVVDDPIAARLSAIVANSGGSAAPLVAGLLSLTGVFGDELAAHPGLREQLVRQLDALLRQGIRLSIRALLKNTSQEPQS